MKNIFYLLIISIALSACSSLEKQSAKLSVGSTKSDVAKVMEPAPYKFTHEYVTAWSML